MTVTPAPGSIWKARCSRISPPNGNGELTGLEWVRESGMLTSAIGLTNTHSVGVVRDTLIAHEFQQRGADAGHYWSLPVVGETWDGLLNDLNGFHVRPDHVHEAIAAASDGPVPEGSVGSGTGMICHGFKGGIGTASRVRPAAEGGYTVGAPAQGTTVAASASRSTARRSAGETDSVRTRFQHPPIRTSPRDRVRSS